MITQQPHVYFTDTRAVRRGFQHPGITEIKPFYVGGTVAWWFRCLALGLQGEELLGCSTGCCDFLPSSKDVHFRLFGDSWPRLNKWLRKPMPRCNLWCTHTKIVYTHTHTAKASLWQINNFVNWKNLNDSRGNPAEHRCRKISQIHFLISMNQIYYLMHFLI